MVADCNIRRASDEALRAPFDYQGNEAANEDMARMPMKECLTDR
jgi:hypothetical protein